MTVLLALTLSLSLSGCSWLTTKVEASYTPVPKPNLVLPDADEVRMRDIEWYIITPENAEEVFAELQADGESVVLFGLTSSGYERISLNLSDVRAFLQQQQSIIGAYKKYYLESDKALEEANKQLEQAKKESEDDSWLPW